jgi:hypothetical protein
MTDTKLPPEVILVAPKRKLSAAEYEERRAERTEHTLWWLLSAAKTQMDLGVWGPFGLFEVHSLLEAIAIGASHPLIKIYKKRVRERRRRKRGVAFAAGRPLPTYAERLARRYMVLGRIALTEHGLEDKTLARERMVEAAAKEQVFNEPPTAEALKHWEQRLEPVLCPLDKNVIASAVARTTDRRGVTDLDQLAFRFIGFARAVLHPQAQIVAATQ